MTECVTPDGYPYTTSYDTCPPPITATSVAPQRVERLPETGAAPSALLGLAVILVAAGRVLRRVVR